MASRIEGITVEINGSTQKLSEALKKVDSQLNETQRALWDVDRLLKFNPGNTTLLAQKQTYLTSAIAQSKNRAEELQKQLDQMKASGAPQQQIEALEREIVQTESKAEAMEKELRGMDKLSLTNISSKMKDIGDKMKSTGETLTKYVTVPLMALGGAGVKAFNEVDSGADIVIQKTGATGKAAAELQTIFENVAKNVPTDFETAGKAVGEVSTRFGVTGQELENLSTKFVKFAQLNEQDVSDSVDKVQTAMSAFGLGANEADGFLDVLNKTAQDTGIDMGTLQDQLVKNAPALKQMGLGANESAAFLGKLEVSGVDSSKVLTGLQKALTNAAKEGKPMNQALSEMEGSMKNAKTEQEGITAACELFGKKAGPAIYQAVKDGVISFEDLANGAVNAEGNLDNTFEATQDGADEMKQAFNNIKISLSKLGAVIGNVAAPIVEKFAGFIQGLADKFNSLNPKTQELIVKIGMVAAAVGPLLVVIGSIVGAIPGIVAGIGLLFSPIGLVVAAIAGIIAIGVALVANWGKIKQGAIDLKNNLAKSFNEIWNAIKAAMDALFKTLRSVWNSIMKTIINIVKNIQRTVVGIWNALRTTLSGIFNSIKSVVVTVWNGIKTAITTAITVARNTVAAVASTIRNHLTFSGLVTTVLNTFTNVKKSIGNGINGASKLVHTAVTNIRTFLKFSGLGTAVGAVFNTVKSFISNPLKTARDFVSKVVAKIKEFLGFSGLGDTVKGAFETIGGFITSPISTAKKTIGKLVKGIKDKFDIFPIDLGNICKFKLPKITVSGGTPPWGIGGKGTAPSFGIEWKRKAMDLGQILDGATIFGMDKFGRFLGGGEAGQEVVVGKKSLLTMVRQASASGSAGTNTRLANIERLLRAYLPKDTTIVLDTGAVAGAVNRKLGMGW